VIENITIENCIESGETSMTVNKQKAANKFYNTYKCYKTYERTGRY
jgi:hypothetical protein